MNPPLWVRIGLEVPIASSLKPRQAADLKVGAWRGELMTIEHAQSGHGVAYQALPIRAYGLASTGKCRRQ